MLDMETGRVAYAVLSYGRMLGMGDKLFAVPWQALQLDTANKRFILDIDKSRLEMLLALTRMIGPTWQTRNLPAS